MPRLEPQVAHDMRSMINALLLAVEILQRGDETAREEATEVARRKAWELSDYVDQLSGTSRPQRDAEAPRPKGPPPGKRVLVVEDD